MRGRGLGSPSAVALAVLTPVVVWACVDFDAVLDPAGGLPDVVVEDPSFPLDVQPIFTRRCATGGCHTVASHQRDLILAEGYAYDEIVNRPSMLSSQGLPLVDPGNPANSWLVRMISADEVAREGHPRMPLASTPLTPNQIATIVNWIVDGAPPD